MGTKSGTSTTADNGVALYIHGSETPVVGTVTVRVQHQDQLLELPLIVVASSGPSPLGRTGWPRSV